VSGRSYLSIGDVLALLRQEFPDVTISKIRFLESQGLVDPERTPSGYRKFYDTDVERLRWVLRQQREHFLPLKVIKGRLEQEVSDGEEANGAVPEPGDGGAAERHEPVLVGRAAARTGPQPGGHELPGFEGPGFERPGFEAPGRAAATGTGRAPGGARVGTAATTATETTGPERPGTAGARSAARSAAPGAPAPHAGAGRAAPGAMAAPTPAGGTARAAQHAGEVGGASTRPVASRAPASRAGAGGGTGASPRGATPGPRGATTPAEAIEPPVQTLSGASMTADELAQACGLDVPAVQQLESYGLLGGRTVGGVAYYDEDALVVARLAAGFARYGVEARHLRLHKHAAEREAGFIEQIVLPLLKQRNPEARQRAHDAVADLTRLGQGMREVLLRTTLRDQLGG
jgi:DNA-binding transcriptional MerR regulator